MRPTTGTSANNPMVKLGTLAMIILVYLILFFKILF